MDALKIFVNEVHYESFDTILVEDIINSKKISYFFLSYKKKI